MRWLALAGWLLLCFAAAALGAAGSADAPGFYGSLVRPSWAPPASWFGPVWTLLYTMMAVAAWLVWRARPFSGAIGVFLVQLALNALWTWVFFRWRAGGAAFGEILLLLLFIIVTAVAFGRISRPARMLLVPYVVWVAYAAALNFALWQANPALQAAIRP